jgi:hypothetical protein
MKKNELIKIIADLQADMRWIKDSVHHLEDNNLWITRLVIGTILTAMIGTIFVLGK